jgi:hypothetical protein
MMKSECFERVGNESLYSEQVSAWLLQNIIGERGDDSAHVMTSSHQYRQWIEREREREGVMG